MIKIESKRRKLEKLAAENPGAVIIDVTSHAQDEFIRLSPFYPNGGIPVPFMEGVYSESVEGIWQGLKVFEKYFTDPVEFKAYGIDPSKFKITKMKNLKRTCKKFGWLRGHKKGDGYIPYIQARKEIYVPTYFWMLEHRCADLVDKLRSLSNEKTVILLDYDTNPDIEDYKKPLSHASLIKRYIEEHP